MKKLTFLLILIPAFFTSIAQKPQITRRSSGVVTVQDDNLFAGKSFRGPVYQDTVSINMANILDSCGLMVYTRVDDAYWYRSCFPSKHWVKMGVGTVDSNTVIYNYVSPDSIYYISCSLKRCDSVYYVAGSGSGGGGSGITYPYTINKYLNGYGDFPTLNTDSIIEGGNNKFSQWTSSSEFQLYYPDFVGIGFINPLYKLDVNGEINTAAGYGGYMVGGISALKFDNTNNNWALAGGALPPIGTEQYNLVIGTNTHNNISGAISNNIAIGYNSQKIAIRAFPMGPSEGGSDNISIGRETLTSIGQGYQNTVVGSLSMADPFVTPTGGSGYGNVAMGYKSLFSGAGTYGNTVIGSKAGSNALIKGANTIIGFEALLNANAEFNTAIGTSIAPNLTGDHNTIIGANSMNSITSGTYNTSLGEIDIPSTSSYNTIIGKYATASVINNNIVIADGQSNVRIKVNASGILNIGSKPDYVDNAAAITAGLVVGDVYRTGDLLKIVH